MPAESTHCSIGHVGAGVVRVPRRRPDIATCALCRALVERNGSRVRVRGWVLAGSLEFS